MRSKVRFRKCRSIIKGNLYFYKLVKLVYFKRVGMSPAKDPSAQVHGIKSSSRLKLLTRYALCKLPL